MRKEFAEELIRSGWIHRPLSVKREGSMDAERKNRSVLAAKEVWAGSGGAFLCREQGQCRILSRKVCRDGVCREERYLEMEGALRQDGWPEGMPQDGDCAYYGNLSAALLPGRQDWSSYSRLRFRVRPVCKGLHTISLSAWVKNGGEEKVPDEFGRTGQHMVNLENGVWNDCIWEFGSMARDCIEELEFRYRLSGSDTGFGEKAVFEIKDIFLEQTEEEKNQGWETEGGQICYDSCGYFPAEEKKAVTDLTEGKFRVVTADTGETVLEKCVETVYFHGTAYGVLDFSEVRQAGDYRLTAEGRETLEFQVGTDWAEEMVWKGLNFLFCQRCGYPVPGKHGRCHGDCYAEHKGERISYAGGWHDAGDMSQQTVQTAEITEALFGIAGRHKGNALLYERVMEEACWGLSFVLGTRFGDGYRATSLGLIRWTDGITGNQDDASNVRVFHHGMDNFICACAEAAAAGALQDYDPESGRAALEAAKEDYRFAMERFSEYGFELPVMWEHTYGSPVSLCYAVIGKCAGLLYERTKERNYAEDVRKWAGKLLECQEEEGEPWGYFYRDDTKEHIVHFSHQAREAYYADCLIAACRLCGEGEEGKGFRRGLERYGDYFEALMGHASPYGMMPAGFYREEEARHEEVFRRMHLLSDYGRCREDYVKQVREGERLPGNLFLRQFPVWFSFRGNTNVQLSMAQAALRVGRFLGRPGLVQAAAEQIHWLNGKNPFRQSLMTGNGKRYDFFYAVFPGICVGQVPVGIQTKKNEDFPYWPAGNQATYREVWTSPTIKVMDICAELLKY